MSALSPENRVLVVGTTPDYIDWIRRACPQRCLFVTDGTVRRRAQEPCPQPAEEVLCDLTDIPRVLTLITAHSRQWRITIDGVACFDCESLSPAADLARYMGLSFHSPQTVVNCRDKMLSKIIWLKKGLCAPRTVPVRQAVDAVAFFRDIGTDCVLKPVSGSGSELVFRCRCEEDCRRNFNLLSHGLERRTGNRLYTRVDDRSATMIAETFVDGDEFSCDFFLENKQARLIRLSKKISALKGTPFGTTAGYLLVDELPDVDLRVLSRDLATGATALGLFRAICMADFMVKEGKIVLLEITPRPGGDCLPALIRQALGVDMLILALALAQNRPLGLDKLPLPHLLAGLRLHARQAGILKKVNWQGITGDPRVREINVLRQPGDRICLPPDDYETFLLGNIIFAPDSKKTAVDECRQVLSALTVEMEA